MKKITTARDLKEAILELEIRQANEKMALKEQFNSVRENLRPVNLIKNTFKEVTTTSSVKGNILTTVAGLAIGYIAKKAIFGFTRNPIKKIAGTIIQMGVATSVPRIKSVGESLLKHFSNSRQEKKEILDKVGQI
jgi:hypothetical protein